MKALLAIFFTLITSLPTLAGGSGIRGGNIITCKKPNGKLTAPVILDYFESSVNPRMAPQLPGKVWEEKVEAFLARVAARDRFFGAFLASAWRMWPEQALITSRVKIPRISDANPRYEVKEECHLKQAAVQELHVRAFEPWYLIDEEIWNGLDETNRAGLVIHELIYRFALEYYGPDHPDSDHVRYFNGVMSSAPGATLPQVRYGTLAETSRIGSRTDWPLVSAEGYFSRGSHSGDPRPYEYIGGENLFFLMGDVAYRFTGWANFHEDGSIELRRGDRYPDGFKPVDHWPEDVSSPRLEYCERLFFQHGRLVRTQGGSSCPAAP